MKTALVILADGFESLEAVTVIDVLRRAGVEANSAGLHQQIVSSAREIAVKADSTLKEVAQTDFDAIILPGGEPGASHLQESELVKEVVRRHYENGKLIGAICAAPRILDEMGLLKGKKATSYPAYKENCPSCDYQEEAVVQDGNIITSRGPATALPFAYKLVENLMNKDTADRLRHAMLYDHVLQY